MLPIRKISPTKVALTSYYGKIFVTKTNKKVFDYGRWLRDKIVSIALDKDNPIAISFTPGNSFDNYFKCPKMYSTLAMGFRSLDIKIPQPNSTAHYQFIFDHTTRTELIHPDLLARYDTGELLVVGKSAASDCLVMDNNNVIYAVSKNNMVQIGTIEDLLNIDITNAPKDFIELKILGKNIPIGLILGYELGITKVIKLLKATYRKVLTGQRLNLQPHEYALQFSELTQAAENCETFASFLNSSSFFLNISSASFS